MMCMNEKVCAKNGLNKKLAIGAAAVLLVGGAWYAFRPEKLIVDQRVSEAAVAMMNQLMILAKGKFHGVAHETKGDVSISKLADGRRVLRFENFETSNGPDLRVLLVAANDTSDSAAVKAAERLELASLKGNIGDQNYEIPADVDLGKYKSVTVWCNRFGVNFATAPLAMGS